MTRKIGVHSRSSGTTTALLVMKLRRSFRSRMVWPALRVPPPNASTMAAWSAGTLKRCAITAPQTRKARARMKSSTPYSTSPPTEITASMVSVSRLRLLITRS